MLALRTKREIERANYFEKKGKLKQVVINLKYYQYLKANQKKIIINDNEISFANGITVLGLNITRTGITRHLNTE